MSDPHDLDQFFTPFWACEALVERHFGHLSRRDLVLEPTCGEGAFLAALPAHVDAIGVEIDPVMADRARNLTGRRVITGDFRTVKLDVQPTAMIGNPPFSGAVVDGIMLRAHALLPDGAVAGMVMPAYLMQRPSRVEAYLKHWSIHSELLPSTLFPRLSKPLLFCVFRKGRAGVMVGLGLFEQVRGIDEMHPVYRELITRVSRSAWATAVGAALANLGGEADLETIYRAMEKRRPTPQVYWKDKIRQVLREPPFVRLGIGRFSLPEDWKRSLGLNVRLQTAA